MSQTNESCTRFAKLLGIEVPFLNAPMEGIATPELVAAVSEAGVSASFPPPVSLPTRSAPLPRA